MPRKPGISFYHGHWVTKAGCGDGPPRKLVPGKGKSDRDSKRQAEELLRELLVEHDRNRGAPRPVSQITVADPGASPWCPRWRPCCAAAKSNGTDRPMYFLTSTASRGPRTPWGCGCGGCANGQ